MKLYKKIGFALLGVFISLNGYAQGGQSHKSELKGMLQGVLLDQNKVSVPFATVAVHKLPDSTVVSGSITDDYGKFQMSTPQSGSYYLKFSSIGYTSVTTKSFAVQSPAFFKDFGTITLKEETTALNEVTIKAWKPQVKVESGKTVINVEGTALAAGNTAYNMLSRAPGVSVDQSGNFMINGKKGVTVTLNGRQTYLSGEELKSLLESMPAENIREIEVVHTPSAKYDAEGTSGVLNIKLKENKGNGFNGSVYGGYTYNKQKFFNGGFNLNHKRRKWNSFLNVDYSKRGIYRDMKTVRTFPGNADYSVFSQSGTQGIDNYVPSIQFGTDFNINDNHSIGVRANLIHRDTKSDWNTLSALSQTNGNVYVDIDSKNHLDDTFKNKRFNVHYQGKLDTLGTTISADLDYARLKTDSNSDFINQYQYPSANTADQEHLNNKKNVQFDIYSARVDFSTPLSSSSKFESGIKASEVISDSDLKFYEINQGSFQLDPDRSNRFEYREHIYAAYASYSNRINDTWNLQFGLRAEQTIGEAKLFQTNETSNRNYLKLFPNIMIEQNISDNYKLNYSFNRRIKRPNYQFLNPSIFYLDPYSYIVGNPDLRPQISNSIKVGQTFFKKFNLQLAYDFTNNYMTETPATNQQTGENIYTTKNINFYRSYNATLIVPFKVTSFWKVNNTLVLTREDYNLEIDGVELENNNLFSMLQSNQQISLPGGISMELSTTVRSAVGSGIYTVDGMWWMDLGLKKSFMDDKLNVSLRATDIFRSEKMHVEAAYVGNTFTLDQYFYNQALSLNLRYTFNHGNKAKKKSRSNDLEELNRAGG